MFLREQTAASTTLEHHTLRVRVGHTPNSAKVHVSIQGSGASRIGPEVVQGVVLEAQELTDPEEEYEPLLARCQFASAM